MAIRDLPPMIEDEILDRPLLADGWTFSCCESVSDEEEPLPALEIEDEVLDRPWQADGFYTICCTMGISPEDKIVDRPKSGKAAAVARTSKDDDRMVDTMLRAGGAFGETASH